MNDEELIAEVRDILADWTGMDGEALRVENLRRFWLIAGTDPRGVRRSGVRDNPISLARTLASQVEPEPAPEPVAGPVTPDETVLTPGDVSEDASPGEDEGGSFYADDPEEEPDLVGDILDEMALGEHEPVGVGVMVNNIGGVMAADRTAELRAKRIGETVMEHRRLVEASYTFDEARTLQRLRSKMNAAVDRTGEPLTEDEERELDRLAIEELWAGRMDTELQRRLSMLNEADGDALQTYNAREGWADL